MAIEWMKNVDAVLAGAQSKQRAVLVDFSAAPM